MAPHRRLAVATVLALAALAVPTTAEEPKPRPVEELIRDLGSKFGKQREQAARDLGAIGSGATAAVPGLKATLADGYEPARVAAAVALSRIDPAAVEAVPVLLKGALSPKPEYRVPAVEALGRYPPSAPGVLDGILGALRSPDLKAVAARALCGMGEPVVDPLLRILEKEDPSMSGWCLDIARGLGSAGVRFWLALMDHPNRGIRAEAGRSLCRELRPFYPEEVRLALAVLENPSCPAEEMAKAADALAKAGAASVPGLAGLLGVQPHGEVRVRAAMALARLRSAAVEAIPALRAASREFTPAARESALAALEAIGPPPGPIPTFMKGDILPPLFEVRRDRKKVARWMPLRPVGPAVTQALDWLARHQGGRGAWDCAGFHRKCTGKACDGPGFEQFTVGVTGLALLAFLAEGETPASTRHGEVVRKGLEFLVSAQDKEGCIGRGDKEGWWVFNHAVSALALVEAAGMTGSLELQAHAQEGLNFSMAAQNPYLAWRYGVRPQDNDTAVTAWMVLGLGVGQALEFDIDPACFDGPTAWLDKVTEPERGRAGYTTRGDTIRYKASRGYGKFPTDRTEGLTAQALTTRYFAGGLPHRDLEIGKASQNLVAGCVPSWDAAEGTVDFHYWHFGALALHLSSPDGGKDWQAAAVSSLLDHQRRDLLDHAAGSWDPDDPWSFAGGRVYATAINCLTLQTPWRYQRHER